MEGIVMKIGKVSVKKDPKFKLSSILGTAALGLLALLVISSIPDVKRYIEISSM